MFENVTLYRPTGPKELKLLEETGFTKRPPRLPEQPIFYPVTNEEYAKKIATKWNVPDSGIGYVTRFKVMKKFRDNYEVKCVGTSHHTDWWIPAEDLDMLNANIVGIKEVIGVFR